MNVITAAISSSDRLHWGPRLWRFMHLLAEVSDRRDMPILWQNLLNITSTILPCEKCRIHMQNYLKTHAIIKVHNLHLVTGVQVQTQIRQELFKFHNHVNDNLKKPLFTKEDLEIYSISESQSRKHILTELYSLLNEIVQAWTPLLHTRIMPFKLNSWKSHVHHMLLLVSAGSY